MMRTWKVTDDRNNSVVVTAPSRIDAKKAVARMMPGMRGITITEVSVAGQRSTKRGRNALCFCNSGKKFKRCHGRRKNEFARR